jgi:tRNA(adenine34) deaminase
MATEAEDEAWMQRALALADEAGAEGEVPVGAVVVGPDGVLRGSGKNRREHAADPTAHAEMEALRDAAAGDGGWRLAGATVYVTLEPCVMCAGALVLARIGRLVYGADDAKAGAIASLFVIGSDPRLHHRFAVTRGVLADACGERLRRFFAARRG